MRLKLCPQCKEAFIADIFVVYVCDDCQDLNNEVWQQTIDAHENDLWEQVEKKYGIE